MGELERQDSTQLSEELQFVTACLIGHYVTVQTNSFLLSGVLVAANFDKDYGVIINVAGKDVHHGKIKIFLKDIVYISAKNVSLDLDKDAMLGSCRKENHSKRVTFVPRSSAGQSGENTQTAQPDVASFASSLKAVPTTNTVPDQKVHHPSHKNTCATVQSAMSMATSTTTGVSEMASYAYPLNSIPQPMMPIMQPAQTDNSFQAVAINPQPITIPVLYQPPNNYGGQWQYPNAGGQFVTYVHLQYPEAAQVVEGYVPHLDPQVQGYIYQPQYQPGLQNFAASNQVPRGHQGPR